jgi:hypothetical protein
VAVDRIDFFMLEASLQLQMMSLWSLRESSPNKQSSLDKSFKDGRAAGHSSTVEIHKLETVKCAVTPAHR